MYRRSRRQIAPSWLDGIAATISTGQLSEAIAAALMLDMGLGPTQVVAAASEMLGLLPSEPGGTRGDNVRVAAANICRHLGLVPATPQHTQYRGEHQAPERWRVGAVSVFPSAGEQWNSDKPQR